MSTDIITGNDLKAILGDVLPVYNNSGAIQDVLYTGAKVSSGTITLSKAYTNYDYLVVTYLVNVDECTKTFDCTALTANPTHNFINAITVYTNASTVYSSTCGFKPATTTSFTITNSGNNVNFVTGITKIVGVKNPLITAEITDLADYIVEQGTSGIWTYRKWNSGIAECWGEYDKSVTGVSVTAPFSGYNFDLGTVAFPTGLFNAKPVCTVNGRKNGNYTCVSYSNPSSTGIAIEFQSSVSGTATCEAHIHAKGTWK